MSVALTSIDDIVNFTLPIWRKNRYKDISVLKRRYEWVSRFMKNSKRPIAAGLNIQAHFKVFNTGSGRYTGLYGTRNVTTTPLMKKINVPWSLMDFTWGYDIREPAFQGGDRGIIQTLETREQSLYVDIAEFCENAMWTRANSDTDDPVQIYGIPTWVVKGSNTNFAFGGLDPSGHSNGVGGLSSATYARYANGSFIWSQITNEDLFRKWAEAHEKCNFKPPYAYDGDSSPSEPDWVNYTTYPVVAGVQNFLTGANDNLKNDAGRYRGEVNFRGTPIKSVAALDDSSSEVQDTQHPIYGIDWTKLRWNFLRGWDMKMTGPEKMPNQTHARFVQCDMIGNFVCEDRSAMYVGHTTTFEQ